MEISVNSLLQLENGVLFATFLCHEVVKSAVNLPGQESWLWNFNHLFTFLNSDFLIMKYG